MSAQKPRICHAISGLMTGGAEQALFALLRSGLADRYDTTVISLLGDGPMVEPIRATGARVLFLDLSRKWRAPFAPIAIRRVAKYLRSDVVQGWMYHGNLAATLMAAVSPGNPKLAWNVRQDLNYDLSAEKPLTRRVIQMNRFFSSRPDTILYNADRSRHAHETYGFSGTQSLVIPNGFDTQTMQPDDRTRRRARTELGFSNSDFVFLHAARLHPMKDQPGMLTAAVECLRSCPQARFVLAGKGVTPDLPAFSSIVPPKLRAKFSLLGERRDVSSLIQAADCTVVSSARSEGFPNVLGEAMAFRTPTVTTDTGDSAAVVGETGMVVPPSDPSALAKAMTEMASDPARAAALGRAGRARVEARFDISRAVDAYDTLYQNLIASKKGKK